MQHVVPRAAEPPKRTVLLRRALIARVGFGALCLLIVAGSYAFATGWEVAVLRSSAAAAQREALASAHASAVHLVSRTLALQSALDAQEDHDRAMLQTYLKLERERLPALAKGVERALDGSPEGVRDEVTHVVTRFQRETSSHVHQMVDALQRQGAKTRGRAAALAQEIAELARADRQRLRSAGGGAARWSDAELTSPLEALLATLQRPNATFALAPSALAEWERVAAEAAKDVRPSRQTHQRMQALAAAAPLPQNYRPRSDFLGASDVAAAGVLFVRLLQRARLHARRDDLVDALERWKRGATSVWEVVELVEQLRAQHVFPIGLLKLGGADETWDEIVGDVKAALQPAGGDHFDAEN